MFTDLHRQFGPRYEPGGLFASVNNNRYFVYLYFDGLACKKQEINQVQRRRSERQRTFCGLHLVHAEGTVSDVQGSKVESVSCPRTLDPRLLNVGGLYQLSYELYDTKNGKAARLVDLLPVDEPEPEGKK